MAFDGCKIWLDAVKKGEGLNWLQLIEDQQIHNMLLICF